MTEFREELIEKIMSLGVEEHIAYFAQNSLYKDDQVKQLFSILNEGTIHSIQGVYSAIDAIRGYSSKRDSDCYLEGFKRTVIENDDYKIVHMISINESDCIYCVYDNVFEIIHRGRIFCRYKMIITSRDVEIIPVTKTYDFLSDTDIDEKDELEKESCSDSRSLKSRLSGMFVTIYDCPSFPLKDRKRMEEWLGEWLAEHGYKYSEIKDFLYSKVCLFYDEWIIATAINEDAHEEYGSEIYRIIRK